MRQSSSSNPYALAAWQEALGRLTEQVRVATGLDLEAAVRWVSFPVPRTAAGLGPCFPKAGWLYRVNLKNTTGVELRLRPGLRRVWVLVTARSESHVVLRDRLSARHVRSPRFDCTWIAGAPAGLELAAFRGQAPVTLRWWHRRTSLAEGPDSSVVGGSANATRPRRSSPAAYGIGVRHRWRCRRARRGVSGRELQPRRAEPAC